MNANKGKGRTIRLSDWSVIAGVVLLCIAALGQAQTLNQSQFSQCESGDLQVCNSIGIYYDRSDQPRLAVQYFRRVCDGGAVIGCSNMAELYYDGRGVDRDYQTALGLFHKSCGESSLSGCAGMCVALAQTGQLNPDARDACRQALDQSCSGGNPWMCNRSLPASAPTQVAPPAVTNSGSGGCQGQNFVRSRKIIEVAWLGGLEIAGYMVNTDDFLGGLNRLIALSNQLNSQAQQLPHACQVLIKAWSDQIGQVFGGGGGGGGTNCMGGVCCNDGGCY